MIKRILLSIIALLVVAFILVWVLGGGFQQIAVAVGHYRDPFKSFLPSASSTGESFNLPGTPSTYPTVEMPTGVSTTSYGPTTVYTPGSGGANGTQ